MKDSANFCENCDRPLYHLSDFGTNKDGSINTEYCRACFQDGEYTYYGSRPERKINKKITDISKTVIPDEEGTFFVHSALPELERLKGLNPIKQDF